MTEKSLDEEVQNAHGNMLRLQQRVIALEERIAKLEERITQLEEDKEHYATNERLADIVRFVSAALLAEKEKTARS